MIKLIDLLEAKQVGILYHFTTAENLLAILSSNKLAAMNYSDISFTRNKNYLNEPGSYGKKLSLVRLSIDGDKLSQNYKISPFHNSEKFNKKSDEYEERISRKNLKNGKIDNIKDYITEITIDKNGIMASIEYDYTIKLLQNNKYDKNTSPEKVKQLASLEYKKFYVQVKKYNIPIKEEILNKELTN
jgi:hypothetical protein